MRDIDVRCVVRAGLRALHDGDPSTVIVEEMGIWSGSVRIDLAVINGELSGIELKSARDTLNRLPMQASLYNAVFDRVTLVAASKHLREINSMVPSWWGLTIAHQSDQGLELSSVRPSGQNYSQDALQIARLLWREECIAILANRDAIRGYKSANCDRLWRHLTEIMPITNLKDEVRGALKTRKSWLRKPITSQLDMPIVTE